MKITKYPLILLIFFLFFLMRPLSCFPWELGGKAGFSFQSFYLDGKDYAKEVSRFGFQTSLFFEFLPYERFLLMAELGFSGYFPSFYSPWAGLTMAFVIYPEYLPFIGISVREHFYSQIFNKKNQWVTGLYLSVGSKVFIQGPHTLWLFFDYLIFQSLYKTYSSSNLSFSLAYSYRFGLLKTS